MIYFDYAATSLHKPKSVISAVGAAMESFGNPSRSVHSPSLSAGRIVAFLRQQLATYFGNNDPTRVVLTANATMSLNLAIASVEGHIVTTEAEHNSVLRPVYHHGNYTIVPVDGKGRVAFSAMQGAMKKDTKAVVIGHGSNLTGNLVNIQMVGDLCREQGVLLIVDGAQTAGLVPIHQEQMGIDALCLTGHKSLYGPQGTGALLLGPNFSPRPMFFGGTGSNSFLQTQPAALPDLLEAGTLNAHGAAGLLAGLDYVVGQGEGVLCKQANDLAWRFVQGIREIPEVVIYGDMDAKDRLPVVAINLGNLPADEVADFLWVEGEIAVRSGFHCAPLLHQRFGTAKQGAVRFSFSHNNTAEEVDLAIKILKQCAYA